MAKKDLEKLRFPIGRFKKPNPEIDPAKAAMWIASINQFPLKVKLISLNLTNTQIQWPYRPGGWTIKQVIHHCVDSHMNAGIRLKMCLTEDTPIIKPYREDLWAELADYKEDNISDSLLLLELLHKKWVLILKKLSDDDLKLEFFHPEHDAKFNIYETLANYAWHCEHHLAHIKQALNSKGKYLK